MKNKETLAYLTVIWGLFLVWEFQIQTLEPSSKNYEIRYDLLVLPLLVAITIYAIYNAIRKNRNS